MFSHFRVHIHAGYISLEIKLNIFKLRPPCLFCGLLVNNADQIMLLNNISKCIKKK